MNGKRILKALMTIIAGLSMVTHAGQNASETSAKISVSTEQALQTFYQQPTFLKFIHLTTDAVRSYPPDNLLLIFSTMAIDKHPDYAKKIAENFHSYSSKEKELLVKALDASDNKNTINVINNSYHYKIDVASQFTVKKINTLKINDDADNLDRLWTAYLATGDSIYLLKMIRYVNADDFILITAYEMVNRKYLCELITHLNKSPCPSITDLVKVIEKQYPNNSKQMFRKMAVVSSALWSLESNRHQDKFIDKKIKQIFDENPELDYWKKINRALKMTHNNANEK